VESELLHWLMAHIKGTDTQLLPCVKASAARPVGSAGGSAERPKRPSARPAAGPADGPARPKGTGTGGDPQP